MRFSAVLFAVLGLVSPTPLAAGDSSPLLVDWGGNYLPRTAQCQPGWVEENGLDLDGQGGLNDERHYYVFDDSRPNHPPLSGDYTAGPSYKYYSAIVLEGYGSPLANRWLEVWNQGRDDQLYYSTPTTPSTGWALWYWKREDFMTRQSGAALSAPVSIEVLDYQGADGVVELNSGRVRALLRDGEDFYLSESFGTRSTSSFRIASSETERWARFNPQRDEICFDAQSADFRRREFRNVTAVGFYHSNDNSTATDRKAGFTAARFRACLLEDEAPPPSAQSLPDDCNRDAHVDISDAFCMLVELFGEAREPCRTDAGRDNLLDHNGDGDFNLSDAVGLLRFLFQSGAPPTRGETCVGFGGCEEACNAG